MCYSCNDNKSDSEPETAKPLYIKDSIPRAVKNCLWINYFGDKRVGVCACCQREPITINNFHAGHIKSQKEQGPGSTTLDNLAPICPLCNLSMGTMHMMEFITKYNL
ncbi:MAG: HNH endonuclease, partial [bacterium]